MENEVAVRETQYPMTAMGVVAQVRLVQEVMKAVMKKDTHYGTIPGCQKPSLWKPGAEVLLVTFRIATESVVEDLSTADEARYRVTRKGTAINSGLFVGSGVGECSSNEEKYKWRFAVCDAEWDDTPEDRRRKKYKRDGTTIKQVRTNHADMANTILKMADKRAFVALALNATAASDCFVQDLEDLPAEVAEGLENGGEPARAPISQAKPKTDGDPHTSTFVPEVVNEKSGEGAKGPWTKWGVKLPDGEFAGTFNEEFGAMLTEAKDSKKSVTLTWKPDGKFRTIASLVVA